MSENPFETPDDGQAAAADTPEETATKARKIKHDHDDERVDEWEEESFPASDPPSNY